MRFFKNFKKNTGTTRKNEDEMPLLFEQLMNRESPETIKALLEKGVDVNEKNIVALNIFTPLFCAIAFYFGPEANIIKLLVEFGAKVDARNARGSTPLIFAVAQRNLEAIKILIELGADINAKNAIGNTPLICATITNASSEIIKTLIDFGADVNAKNDKGKTALDYTKDSTTENILKKAMDKI